MRKIIKKLSRIAEETETVLAIGLYHFIENIDGERFIKIMPYPIAERIKKVLYLFIK